MQCIHRRKAILFVAASAAILLTGCQAPGKRPLPAATPAGHAAAARSPSQAGQVLPGAQANQDAIVQFFLAQEKEAKGLVMLQVGDQTFWVMPHPVLNRADLAQVRSLRTRTSNQPFVQFQFSPDGARKLADLTARNQGALLLTLVGNFLLGIQRLDAVVSNGILNIPVRSDQAAIQAAELIAAPPRP